jgi:uncharacterized membrane protein YdjX (TVP38/TMEM64 family)/SAM-dependent methyltransferase
LRSRAATALRIAAAVVFVGALIVVTSFTNLDELFSVERIRDWLSDFGLVAAPAYIGLMAAAIVVSPIPSLPLDVAAGLVFGPFLGTLYSLIGATVGAVAAFSIARGIGGDLVARIVGGHLQFCTKCSDKLLSKVVFVSRLIPVVSFDVVSYGAGLTAMSVKAFALSTFLGMIPLTFVYNYFGSVLVLSSWVGILVAGVLVVSFFLIPRFVETHDLFGLRGYFPHVDSSGARSAGAGGSQRGDRTDLYQVLADHYEEVFPLDPRRVHFCLDKLPPVAGRMIDAGCGTAELCRALIRRGHLAMGIDTDGRMIEKAREATHRDRLFAELHEGSILDTRDFAGDRRFHLIACLGNTLPHLSGSDEIEDFARDARSVLLPGGTLAVQVLNYDRIWSLKPSRLPDLRTERFRLEREYEYTRDEIRFVGTLSDKVTDSVFTGSTLVRPVFGRSLRTVLEKYFDSVRVMAGYDGSPPTRETFALLFVARVAAHSQNTEASATIG